MDAFEQVVAEILWMDGHWVRTSVKVELTKEEKRKIGRPSSPRWELDIVAYNGRDNLLRVVECKSYLGSLGVQAKGFEAESDNASRYKLFNDASLREVIFRRLQLQFCEAGFCPPIHLSNSALRVEKSMNVAGRLLAGHLLKRVGSFGTKTGCVNVLGEWPQEATKTKFQRSYLNSYCVALCRSPPSLVNRTDWSGAPAVKLRDQRVKARLLTKGPRALDKRPKGTISRNRKR